MNMLIDEIIGVEKNADCLYSDKEVEAAMDDIAERMNRDLVDSDPVLLCTMNGAVVFMGKLLTRLTIPLTIDYIHATRYRNTTQGDRLQWIRKPGMPLAGRNVVIVDDIFDEGITLAAMVESCYEEGAGRVFTCVLVNKKDVRKAEVKLDYLGLEVPNRYVYGYGMDYKGYLRNAAGIFAVNEDLVK